MLSYFNRAVDGEQYRGIIVYVYCGKTSDRDIPILQRVIGQYNLDKYPIVFSMLLDSEESWITCLKRRAANVFKVPFFGQSFIFKENHK